MKIEIFQLNDVFGGEDGTSYYLKSARNRMLLMKADLVVVIISSEKAVTIKDRSGENREINSDDCPEFFV